MQILNSDKTHHDTLHITQADRRDQGSGLFAPQVSDANSQLRQDPSRHTPYYAGRPTEPEIWALNPRG